jgi:hypothetical protein
VTREREAMDLHGGIRRQLRALVRRAADGDTLALEALADLEDLAALATTVAGHVMHASADGWPRSAYSWSEIGQVTGTTRQAAHRRHSEFPRDPIAAWFVT